MQKPTITTDIDIENDIDIDIDIELILFPKVNNIFGRYCCGMGYGKRDRSIKINLITMRLVKAMPGRCVP